MISLDGIFDKIIDVKVKPNCTVYLTEPSDHKNLLEVTSIRGVSGKNPYIVVEGLKDSNFLEVGSWIRKRELEGLQRKNRGINFVVGVV